jgi:hypothetical protein
MQVAGCKGGAVECGAEGPATAGRPRRLRLNLRNDGGFPVLGMGPNAGRGKMPRYMGNVKNRSRSLVGQNQASLGMTKLVRGQGKMPLSRAALQRQWQRHKQVPRRPESGLARDDKVGARARQDAARTAARLGEQALRNATSKTVGRPEGRRYKSKSKMPR